LGFFDGSKKVSSLFSLIFSADFKLLFRLSIYLCQEKNQSLTACNLTHEENDIDKLLKKIGVKKQFDERKIIAPHNMDSWLSSNCNFYYDKLCLNILNIHF
jgi:hypothetical protein